MKWAIAQQILKENQKNYDLIAESFDQTRSFLWPEIEATASYIAPKTAVLDVGCGNGRLFPFVSKLGGKYLGFDISEKLISICQKKYGKKYFFVADILKTQNSKPKTQNQSSKLKTINPYYILHTTYCDVVYCLAVFHHIPSHELRLQALNNIRSILKPNGILILSVWNLWQKKYLKYIIREAFLKLIGESKLDWRDCYIPYKIPNPKSSAQGGSTSGRQIPNLKIKNSLIIENCKLKIVNRYLHAFCFSELIHLIKSAGFKIKEAKKTRWNYLVVAKSISNRLSSLKR